MVLTGQPIDGREALRNGLVAEALPEDQVVERAVALAKVIADRAPVAARLAKEAVLAAYETTLAAGLDVERRAIRLACFASEIWRVRHRDRGRWPGPGGHGRKGQIPQWPAQHA